MKFKKIVKEGSEMHPEITNESLCNKCRREIAGEAKKPMKKVQKKQQWWFDIPGAKYIYHGDWSDPEIQYRGFSLNYYDVEQGLLETYREEHPEDKNDRGFDDWLAKQGGTSGYIQGELDNSIYACLGDDNVDEDEWLGIPDAYRIKEVYGQGDGEFVLYKDCLVDISDFDYYDDEYGDWLPYTYDPQKFEQYYKNPKNRKTLLDDLNYSVNEYMSESCMNDESWIGDKAKAGWEKVKSGAKKVGKAIGDAFKGPFRKGDHIVMKGENGESYKGTIKSFDLGDKTYQVLLGNPVNENTESDVLEMGDRVDELEFEIEKLWRRLGNLPDDKDEIVLQLISRYVELDKLEPGRVDF